MDEHSRRRRHRAKQLRPWVVLGCGIAAAFGLTLLLILIVWGVFEALR